MADDNDDDDNENEDERVRGNAVVIGIDNNCLPLLHLFTKSMKYFEDYR